MGDHTGQLSVKCRCLWDGGVTLSPPGRFCWSLLRRTHLCHLALNNTYRPMLFTATTRKWGKDHTPQLKVSDLWLLLPNPFRDRLLLLFSAAPPRKLRRCLHHLLGTGACATCWAQVLAPPAGHRCLHHLLGTGACTTCWCLHHLLGTGACTTCWAQVLAPPAGHRCLHHLLGTGACTTCWAQVLAPPAGCTTCWAQVLAPPAGHRCLHHLLGTGACTTCWAQVLAPPAGHRCLHHLLGI